VSSMLRKGPVRRRHVSKPRGLAERCQGASPAACLALRGTPTLPSRVGDGSERAETSSRDGRRRVTQSPGRTWYGDVAGHPGSPRQTISGAAESGWGIEQHAPSIIALESSGVHPGDLRKEAQAGGRRKARAVRNADAFLRSRMGPRSPSVGKPRTPGRGLPAKAPRLGKYGVQRSGANNVPSERARWALGGRRGYGGARGSNLDARL
jgi:hypothetical protein